MESSTTSPTMSLRLFQGTSKSSDETETDTQSEYDNPLNARRAASRHISYSDARHLQARLHKARAIDETSKRLRPRQHGRATNQYHKNHKSYGDMPSPGTLLCGRAEYRGPFTTRNIVDSAPPQVASMRRAHAGKGEQTAPSQTVQPVITKAASVSDEGLPDSPGEESDNDNNDDDDDDDDDNTASAISSSQRANWNKVRRLNLSPTRPAVDPPPNGTQVPLGHSLYNLQSNVFTGAPTNPASVSCMAAVPADSQGASRSEISESWHHLLEQRNQVNIQRRGLTKLRLSLRQKQKEKAAADHELHMLTLSCSASDKPLPRHKVVELYTKIEKLKETCELIESQYDELGTRLDRKAAKLETQESGFYMKLASGAADSPASTSIARPAPGPGGPGPETGPGLRPGPIPTGAGHRGSTRAATTNRPVQAERKEPIGLRSTTEDRGNVTTSQHASVDANLLGISGERPRDEHPIYARLLQAVGDLRLAREGHEELSIERDDIIEELQSRIAEERSRKGEAYNLAELQTALRNDYGSDAFKSAFASHLGADDMAFLQQWRTVLRQSKTEIASKEKRVGRMREWCRSMGALPAYMPLEEQEAVLGSVLDKERQAKAISVEIDAAVGQTFSAKHDRKALLAHPQFPQLLSNPYHLLESPPVTARAAVARALRLPPGAAGRQQAKEDSVKEYGIESMLTRHVQGNKADFINRWLLQQLRMSPLEVLRLFMIMSGTLHVINLLRWQDDVVYHWPLDDANRRTNFLYRCSTSSDDSQALSSSLSSAPSPVGVQGGDS